MCVLRVSGKRFDPHTFLSQSGLQAEQVFLAGTVRNPPRLGRYADSGFTLGVSPASSMTLQSQIPDAMRFLLQHQTALRCLTPAIGVDDMRLDFQLALRIDGDRLSQSDYLPPDLLALAGALGLGIEMSIYATIPDTV